MSTDHEFPDTQRSWIEARLGEGDSGLAAVRHVLMQLYAGPLSSAASSRFGLSAENATDLVHGFFVTRLANPDYFRQWRESGRRLRHWLWGGLCFYRQEQRRVERRRAAEPLGDDYELADPSALDPGEELERSFAIALVRAAMQRAEDACCAEGLDEHWQVFARQARGETLRAIGAELGLSESQAHVRARAARRRFVAALGELLAADGVPPAEVRRAIEEMVERRPGESGRV
ncbi:MAG: hypothetical protein IPN34_24710 [Planctomycetes bacterium]|nr:hypothetical protein [Planctomycetota bacterium]